MTCSSESTTSSQSRHHETRWENHILRSIALIRRHCLFRILWRIQHHAAKDSLRGLRAIHCRAHPDCDGVLAGLDEIGHVEVERCGTPISFHALARACVL